jgi:HEAT repeat protein
VVEDWLQRDASYRITNLLPWRPKPSAPDLLYDEEVRRLTIYKALSGEILCFRYFCILEDRKTRASIGGLITLVCDLNDDGNYEFRICPGDERAEKNLLRSLLKVKSNLSDESELVRRTVSSALREIGQKR